MNEQALNDAFNLFVQNGYNGDINKFVNLISTNENALNDVHKLFVNTGYNGDINKFKSLIGVGQQQPVQEAPKKKEEDGGMFSQAVSQPFEQTQEAVSQYQEQKAQEQGVQLAPEGTFLRQMQTSSLASEPINAPLELPSKLEERKYEAYKERTPEQMQAEAFEKTILPSTLYEATKEAGEAVRKTESETPKFLKPSISAVDEEFLSKNPDAVKQELEYQFSNAGFEFDITSYQRPQDQAERTATSNLYRNITVKAPNGESKIISLRPGELANSSIELKNFLKENSAALKNMDALEKKYMEEDKKFTTQKAFNDDINLLNESAVSFNKEKDLLFSEKTKLEEEFKTLNSIPIDQRNTPAFLNRVKQYESKLNVYSSKEKNLVEKAEYLSNQEDQLKRSAAKYAEMKKTQGSYLPAIINQFLQSTGDVISGRVDLYTDFFYGTAPLKKALGDDTYEEFKKEKLLDRGFDFDRREIVLAPDLINKDINSIKKELDGKYGNMGFEFSIVNRGGGFQELLVKSPEGQKQTFSKGFNISDLEMFLNGVSPSEIDEIDREIRDDVKKMQKFGKYKGLDLGTTTLEDIRDFLVKTVGSKSVSKEFISAQMETLIGGGILGTAGSLPAMIGTAYTRPLQFFALSVSSLNREMEANPEFENVSENEKLYLKGIVGGVNAVLEEYGFRNFLKGRALSAEITKSLIRKLPTKVTTSQIRNAAIREMSEMGIKFGVPLVSGFLAEAETGTLQQINEYYVKSVYNELKGKEMFDVPEFDLSIDSEYVRNVVRAGIQEGIGGFIMTVPRAVSEATRKNGFEAMDDDRFSMFELMHMDSDARKLYEANLNIRINKGEITEENKNDLLNEYDIATGLFRQIPPEITDVKDKKKVMNLLAEKRKLQELDKVQDPALSKPTKKRIDEINEQLTKITQDAIQKQESGEVPVQSETGVGEEMEGREPQAGAEVTPQQGVISPEEKEKITQNRRVDLFPEESEFADAIGGSGRNSTMSDYSEVDGIGIASYTNPDNGLVDVIMSGTSDNDYVGYVRVYENGKPTNRWTSKMSNESGNKKNFKTMISEVQSRLPENHEYTEKTNISIDGVRVYANQLNRGYEVLIDENGNPVTNTVTLNSASVQGLQEADTQDKKQSLYDNMIVNTREQFNEIRDKINSLMPNVKVLWNQENNTVQIQLPVLASKQKQQQQVTEQVAPVQQTEMFTEQDRARQQELKDALSNADKRRKNITVGETSMPKADVKAELDALNQKELSSQQPAVETAPTTEISPTTEAAPTPEAAPVEAAPVEAMTPEQEADRLEQMLAEKMETQTEQTPKTKGGKLSDKVRSLKIKGPGGLQSNILGVPIEIWNAAMETVATAIDAGKGLVDQAKVLRDALSKGYAEIKDKHKAINKERYEAKVLNRMYSGAIEMAREGKISDTGIKTYLTRKGLTESQADALLKIKPKTEKKAPSADKVIGRQKTKKITVDDLNTLNAQIMLEAKAAKEGAKSVSEALKVITKYFNSIKNRGNLTRSDITKVLNIISGVKDQKSLDKAANAIYEIVKNATSDIIEVSDYKLMTNQIKFEVRAAREAKGDLNTKRKALADAINKMAKAGTITAAQAKTLINRVNKVNLDNPVMVERLIKYAENVFNDADYDTRMQDIRKLQSQARRRKHTSMKDLVKEFTSINPELIPDDKILEYIQALDDLSTRTPSYNAMNGMFSEIVSLKPADTPFDAIKTIDGMVIKWDSINLNEVKSVEDYVNLIRDINSYKKKAYQLLENGVITQEQYDSLMETVGKDQDAVEKKYEKELTELKNKLVDDIKNLKPSENNDFSNEENDLIKKYLEISESDLKQLSPENLYVLNDILENIKNGEMDYYRFSEIVSKAYTIKDGMRVAKDLSEARFDMSTDEGKRKLSEYESSFWEGVLGLGRVKSGAVQKFIISPFMRAISSYENFLKKGYNVFLDLKKKYNIKEKDMHKLGMLTTYLQEYMAQFDPDNKNVKDIGTRDWFKEILDDPDMKSDYPSAKPSIFNYVGRGKSEFDVIKKIWDSLPKDSNGNVDPKAVYESYMANDGKYFTKNEKAFFDATMDWKENNLTSKQKAANELRGNPFKQIAFHMPRVRYDGKKQQIQASATGENGLVRIQAGTGKERTSQKVGAVMTNFEQLFISNLEQTSRDFYLTGALKDINNILSIAKSKLGKKGMPIIKTISQTLSEALSFEFEKSNAGTLNRLLAARAAITLLDPVRTAIELVSTFVSYPFRAKTIKGYKDIYVSVGKMKELLEFTESPLRLRDNINKAIDINDGKIEPQGKLQKALVYLSGLPERTMMVTSWMPTFNQEFKELTGVTFNMKSFKESKEYREKYGKAIKEASAAADAQTEKIIGTTTKAGQRREIRIAPKFLASIAGKQGTVSKNSTAGQILGFFSNYPYREATEFLNGFREAAEVARKGEGVLKAGSQLSKPLGISFNLVTYGYLSAISYALTLILLGDDDDEERGETMLDDLMTTRGFIDEVLGNSISLAASKYAAGGKAMLQVGATMAMMSNIKEEDKVKITKILKNSVFLDPLPIEQATEYGGKDKIVSSIGKYVPQFVVAAERYADLVGTKKEIEYIFKKAQENGVESLTEDEGAKVLALNTLINGVQLGMNYNGLSIPMYNKLKTYMRGLKKEAGVEKIKLEPTEKEKAYGGYETIEEFKLADPKGYAKADNDPNSPLNKKRAEDKKEREANKEKKEKEYMEKYGKSPSTGKISKDFSRRTERKSTRKERENFRESRRD